VRSRATTPEVIVARAVNGAARSNYQRPSVDKFDENNGMESNNDEHVNETLTNNPPRRAHVPANGARTGIPASRRVSHRSPLTYFIDDRDASVAPPSEASYQPSEAHYRPSEAHYQPSEGHIVSREASLETIAALSDHARDDSSSHSFYENSVADSARNDDPPPQLEPSNNLPQDMADRVRREMRSPELGIFSIDQPEIGDCAADEVDLREVDPPDLTHQTRIELASARDIRACVCNNTPPPQIERETLSKFPQHIPCFTIN
jgi:hypothetical protein